MLSMMRGRIEVICGGMFSGKTEELLRRIRRESYARKRVQLFKHALDQRYTDGHVESHVEAKLPATSVSSSADLLEAVDDETHVVGIDEAQFFDEGLVYAASTLANNGKRVIIAGLDMDYKNVPFGPMPKLLAVAEDVTKVRAVCVICGDEASRSFRISDSDALVEVAASESYEARCRPCSQQVVCSIQEKSSELTVNG